jgi:Zn-dependent peptidase ImmA (M78 family)
MHIEEISLNHIVTQFLHFAKSELELHNLPKIELVENSKDIGGSSFGLFEDGVIFVVIANRHPIDVLRTLAHELVHWKQRLENQEMDGTDGSDTENDANAIAGIIMRRFGKLHKEYF